MWIFVDLFQVVSFGTVMFALLLPVLLAVGGFVMAVISDGHKRTLGLVLGLGMTAALIFVSIPGVKDMVEDKQYENPENISIEIFGKENAGDNVFHFDCKVTNHFKERITHTNMNLVITNLDGEVLLQAAIPSSACEPGESDTFILEVTVRGDTAGELYYTDLAYLNVSVTIEYIQYETQGRHINHTRQIRTADEKAMDKAYQNAVVAYDRGDYRQAWELFCTFGNYKDSDYYRQLAYEKIPS